MKRLLIVGAAGLALTLQACNRAEEAPTEAPAETAAAPAMEGMASVPGGARATAPAERQSGPYSTTGEVTAVSGQSVTINHEAVEGLGWPAMTMTFQAENSAMLQDLQPGAAVRFSFRKEGETYVLTEVTRS